MAKRSANKSVKIKKFTIMAIVLVLCALAAFLLSNFLFTKATVYGSSMEATLHDGENLFLFKPGKYRYGDIVVFNTHEINAEGGEKYFVKRIIGVPGDLIEFKKDSEGVLRVYRNEKKLEEAYVTKELNGKISYVAGNEERTFGKIPEGYFFYMGDNRENSIDSGSADGKFGSMDDIVGRVIIKYDGNTILSKSKTVKRIKN